MISRNAIYDTCPIFFYFFFIVYWFNDFNLRLMTLFQYVWFNLLLIQCVNVSICDCFNMFVMEVWKLSSDLASWSPNCRVLQGEFQTLHLDYILPCSSVLPRPMSEYVPDYGPYIHVFCKEVRNHPCGRDPAVRRDLSPAQLVLQVTNDSL